MKQSRNAYEVLVGKLKGKRPLGRPRYRWDDNIKMDLREVDCDPGNWIDLAKDRDQWWAYVRVAKISGFLESQLVSLEKVGWPALTLFSSPQNRLSKPQDQSKRRWMNKNLHCPGPNLGCLVPLELTMWPATAKPMEIAFSTQWSPQQISIFINPV